ncbi:MAG: (S)-ureidoglycine aminohydrolase [Verrucomicrobiota bacterium]
METKDLFGFTRNVVKGRYALLTPGGFVPSYLPGWEKAVCNVLISPAMGARFCQLLITLEHDGQCLGNTGVNQYLIYILDGNASIMLDDRRHRLEAGSYVYLPVGKDVQIKGGGAPTRILIFQKEYQPLPGAAKPAALVGHEREVKGQPFLGNEDARLQVLLPDHPGFDMAVNIFTYQPGATLPFVETHIMEHGLVMLRGQGICRLDADWHPVQAGDVIWMAPYCPQWFVAMGKTPASYIYYKDVNRDPM